MNSRENLAEDLLRCWADWAERHWFEEGNDQGVWGTGYAHWGVQSHQKYLAVMALLGISDGIEPAQRECCLKRAMAALRWTLGNHVTGTGRCVDGTQWGRTWISALGIERMMFGVRRLDPYLTDADRAALRRVLTDEAEWLRTSYRRGEFVGVQASKWNHEGRNHPESNLWNGALLWRVAKMWPDDPRASAWEEQAHCFLINGVSVAADATEDRIVAGRPVRERHVGPNFFDHYALDHHGYMNTGYMTICMSNAAILHFDLAESGLSRPETLDHHQRDLWEVLRRMVFDDGRLVRIGGDSRVRYAYCQEYLLPALLYAADHLGDAQALAIADAQVDLLAREAKAATGGFFSDRLDEMKRHLPHYHLRLESDRACALAMYLAWRPRVRESELSPPHVQPTYGGWSEPEHGDVLHRGRRRFASFAWRSYGWTQALCLPPDTSDLAEYWQNLVSVIRFAGDDTADGAGGNVPRHRRVQRHWLCECEGGFLTCGTVMEGMNLAAESLSLSDMARHDIAIAALPDERTLIGVERIRIHDKRAWVVELKGVHLGIPNDIYNGCHRIIHGPNGSLELTTPAPRDEIISMGGRWANVDGRLGVVLLDGADTLFLSRSVRPRGGVYRSLRVEELCAPCRIETFVAEPGETVLDLVWAVLASADAGETADFAERAAQTLAVARDGDRRAVSVIGLDRRRYTLVIHFGEWPVDAPPMSLERSGGLGDGPHR